MTNLQQEIKNVLDQFPSYWDNGILLKNRISEDVRNYQPELLAALLKNQTIKNTYSLEVNGVHVFKVEDFVSMIRYKNYLENSYTKYSNEIGLTSEGKYLKYDSDVVLDFPHKDGVLEGGMTQEDSGKNEVYYHSILAKEEIDTLLSPKIFKNVKKYDKNGSHEINQISSKDNLIIKGNNLIALHTLKERYSGKVKLIYIDPPYNTGNDSFNYNDRFKHSTWLIFMKNRLEVAKELLSNDGIIFVHIDRNEFAELKVLMDEIFKNQYLGTIIDVSTPNGRDYGVFAQTHDYIHVYANDMTTVRTNALDADETKFKLKDDKSNYYLHPLFNSNSAFHKGNRPNLYYSFFANEEKNNEGYHDISLIKDNVHTVEVYPPLSKTDGTQFVWRWGKEKSLENLNIDIVAQQKSDGSYRIAQKMRPKKQIPRTVWQDAKYSNRRGTEELQSLFSSKVFNFPKPENLLRKIIEIGTNKGDIVLDFFMGSATTQSVAMKMNRRFIGIEQMEYINEVSVPRLQKVINGEQGGISKEIGWNGGGDFIYAELFELNQMYIESILSASNIQEIEDIISVIKSSNYLNIKVELEKIINTRETFFKLTLEEQKDLLIQVVDNNQLYLSYSEIEDDQYKIDNQIKDFNHSFYQEGV